MLQIIQTYDKDDATKLNIYLIGNLVNSTTFILEEAIQQAQKDHILKEIVIHFKQVVKMDEISINLIKEIIYLSKQQNILVILDGFSEKALGKMLGLF